VKAEVFVVPPYRWFRPNVITEDDDPAVVVLSFPKRDGGEYLVKLSGLSFTESMNAILPGLYPKTRDDHKISKG
jgi:hypothetical protein